MPTITEITKLLSEMNEDNYLSAVKYIYFLMADQKKSDDDKMMSQKKFLEETKGIIDIDENAVKELRMGCMI